VCNYLYLSDVVSLPVVFHLRPGISTVYTNRQREPQPCMLAFIAIATKLHFWSQQKDPSTSRTGSRSSPVKVGSQVAWHSLLMYMSILDAPFINFHGYPVFLCQLRLSWRLMRAWTVYKHLQALICLVATF